ncbi:NAD(P)H oxidoreductase [Nocardia transvalensis]|uniref:NAD(P)H oxidoreductase n=1 Tax=Nocardia transvalensis TaxID=37333 RepID=UPI0018931D39|nr:NAD(P)H oxidoreductase [Nocardia transvalensis]MBF6331516.1 NAD(P)H oxidoreductase [Nocardia transvalensis]
MPQTATAPTALVVVAHHRSDSLSAHIARRATSRLEAAGYRIDLLDLQAEGFDPRMTVADEPEWGNRDKAYSAEVREHWRRLLAAEVVVVVFPIYWVSVPALLKGWIDRVWNYGFAYGRSKPRLAGKRILWLGLAGAAGDDPLVDTMTTMLDAQLGEGLAYYCGFSHSTVRVLPDAEDRPQRVDSAGNFVVGEQRTGAARAAHYAEFENTADGYVDAFLTVGERVPA